MWIVKKTKSILKTQKVQSIFEIKNFNYENRILLIAYDFLVLYQVQL